MMHVLKSGLCLYPTKPIKLEFILEDPEIAGILTCYTLLQEHRKLRLLEAIYVMVLQPGYQSGEKLFFFSFPSDLTAHWYVTSCWHQKKVTVEKSLLLGSNTKHFWHVWKSGVLSAQEKRGFGKCGIELHTRALVWIRAPKHFGAFGSGPVYHWDEARWKTWI